MYPLHTSNGMAIITMIRGTSQHLMPIHRDVHVTADVIIRLSTNSMIKMSYIVYSITPIKMSYILVFNA